MEWDAIVGYVLIGIGIGMMLHRYIMALTLYKSPDDICTYCEWFDRKQRYKSTKRHHK